MFYSVSGLPKWNTCWATKKHLQWISHSLNGMYIKSSPFLQPCLHYSSGIQFMNQEDQDEQRYRGWISASGFISSIAENIQTFALNYADFDILDNR